MIGVVIHFCHFPFLKWFLCPSMSGEFYVEVLEEEEVALCPDCQLFLCCTPSICMLHTFYFFVIHHQFLCCAPSLQPDHFPVPWFSFPFLVIPTVCRNHSFRVNSSTGFLILTVSLLRSDSPLLFLLIHMIIGTIPIQFIALPATSSPLQHDCFPTVLLSFAP